MFLEIMGNIETFNTFLLCKEVMPKPGYKALTIPESLYVQLVQYVEDSQGRHVSVSEVVRKAIWDFLQKARSPSHEAN